MHRSRQIWPINGPDLIGISQLAVVGGVNRTRPYGNCDGDQARLDEDHRSSAQIQRSRSTRTISHHSYACTKGLNPRLRGSAICDCDIIISHHNYIRVDAKEASDHGMRRQSIRLIDAIGDWKPNRDMRQRYIARPERVYRGNYICFEFQYAASCQVFLCNWGFPL